MKNGFFQLHRKIIHWKFYKNDNYFRLWLHLLLRANHKDNYVIGGILVKRGQTLCSRNTLSDETGLHRSSIERILTTLEIEQQIEQQKTTKYRIITICKYNEYNQSEQQNEPRLSHERATAEPRLSTNNNDNNIIIKKEYSNVELKNKNNINQEIKDQAKSILQYLNIQTKKNFREVESTLQPIISRLKDGYSAEDLLKVILYKSTFCKFFTENREFLRPITLFNKTKFPNYLEEVETYDKNNNGVISGKPEIERDDTAIRI
jgi:uncharacterized phage protein (TIGR02220 family)